MKRKEQIARLKEVVREMVTEGAESGTRLLKHDIYKRLLERGDITYTMMGEWFGESSVLVNLVNPLLRERSEQGIDLYILTARGEMIPTRFATAEDVTATYYRKKRNMERAMAHTDEWRQFVIEDFGFDPETVPDPSVVPDEDV